MIRSASARRLTALAALGLALAVALLAFGAVQASDVESIHRGAPAAGSGHAVQPAGVIWT